MQEPKSDNDGQLTEQVNQVLTANSGVVACLFRTSNYLTACINANVGNVKGTQTKQVTWSRTVMMKEMLLGPCCKLLGDLPSLTPSFACALAYDYLSDSHQARLDTLLGDLRLTGHF